MTSAKQNPLAWPLELIMSSNFAAFICIKIFLSRKFQIWKIEIPVLFPHEKQSRML